MTSEPPFTPVLLGEVRPGAYHDSIVLMELQVSLSDLEGVLDAGVVMGTRSNLELLRHNGLLLDAAVGARDEDLVIAVRAESRDAGERALGAVDQLLVRRSRDDDSEYRPRSLEAAVRQLPDARWVLVSVPGRYAADVSRQALALGRSVFLYSDNVSIDDEIDLKREAAARGQLVLGPDCGTARVGGAGFGFVNRVRAGSIGLVGPSGTGLQAVSSLVHQAGGGISQILGTGGRDLSSEVGGATTLRVLQLLGSDLATEAIVLVSKPPDPVVARRVLGAAEAVGKPVVVYFQGVLGPDDPPPRAREAVTFARTLAEAADLALRATATEAPAVERSATLEGFAVDGRRRCLRGLFSGGTLALELLLHLRRDFALSSNVTLEGVTHIAGTEAVAGHTVLDLGADELTVGRLHPMIDFDLRLRHLAREAADPDVALVLLDVVLGDGSHPDPAGELEEAVRVASRSVEVVALVVGTDEDPQDAPEVCRRLSAAGAKVFRDPDRAFAFTRGRLGPGNGSAGPVARAVSRQSIDALFDASPAEVSFAEAAPLGPDADLAPDPGALAPPIRAVVLGLESFHRSLVEQGFDAVHVDWRPPAGGDRRLIDILNKLKS